MDTVSKFDTITKHLEGCPKTFIPALLTTLIRRAAKERVFKGASGFWMFSRNAFHLAETDYKIYQPNAQTGLKKKPKS